MAGTVGFKLHEIHCLSVHWPSFLLCLLTIVEFPEVLLLYSYTRDEGSCTVHVFEMPSMPYLKVPFTFSPRSTFCWTCKYSVGIPHWRVS